MYTFTRSISVLVFLFIIAFCITPTFAQTTFQKSYGGTQEEYTYAIEQLSDGGYIMCGRTFSNTINSSWDAQIIRLNSSGDTVWTKNYGNVGYDEFQSIKPTSDGGFIVCGQTDVVDALGDVLLVKIDATGAISWSETYGAASKSDYGYSVRQTNDGGYIVAGSTKSVGTGLFDIVLIKTTSTGAVTWSKVYGGTSDDIPRCVEQTADNGYIVAGYSTSYGSNAQMYLLKVTSTGTTTWSKTVGGSNSEVAYDVKQLSDGSYAVAGYSDSYGAGNFDMMLVKLTSAGAISWSKTYGGTAEDRALGLKITGDNGYILTGFTNSFGGGSSDYYLVKTDAGGTLSWSKAFGGSLEDRAYSIFQTADGGYITTGYANSYGQGMKEVYVVKTNASGVSNCNEVSPATVTNSPTAGNSNGVTEVNGIAETGTAPTIVRRRSTIVIATQCFSAGVTCTVDAAFTSNPTSPVCAGTTVNFTNTSTNATTYKWKVNGTQFATTTNASYSFNTAGSFTIRLVAIDGSCSDSTETSFTVNATVTPSVTIVNNQPNAVCAGTCITYTATPTNGGTQPTFQWYNNNVLINGQSGATYTGCNLNNGDAIKVVITSNAVCVSPATATSNTITAAINPSVTPAVSIVSSVPSPICANTCVTFTATPTNGGSQPTYQWHNNNVLINGQSGATYTACNLTANAAIKVVLTSNANCASPSTATSNTITMQVSNSVTPDVTIIGTPPTALVLAGPNCQVQAIPTNGGNNPYYQWYQNGVPYTGSHTNTFIPPNLNGPSTIVVEMTTSLSCANPTIVTDTFTLQPYTPTVTSSTGSFTLCVGQPVTFTANEGTSWQWNYGLGGTQQSYTFTPNSPGQSNVSLIVYDTLGGCSAEINIDINKLPVIIPSVTITASPNPLCAGDSVLCIATPANGGTPAYTWNINGSDITNSNQDAIIIAPPTNGDVVTVVMESSEACASPTTATSNSITLVVNTPIAPTISQNGPVLTSSAPTNNSWYVVGNPNSIGNQQSYVVTQDGYYYVVYTDANGCSVTTDTIHVILESVVENSGISNLSLYPNPAQNSLTIETMLATGGTLQIDLKNMLGQTVYTCNSNVQPGLYKNTLELNAAPGIYSLTIRTPKGMLSRKIEIVK